ncbi:hypothetical protein HYR54_14990 [Candidatus Acetothermia bacterium]|nr:hypothetical protein [Candidatus Acetothermia bacterium]
MQNETEPLTVAQTLLLGYCTIAYMVSLYPEPNSFAGIEGGIFLGLIFVLGGLLVLLGHREPSTAPRKWIYRIVGMALWIFSTYLVINLRDKGTTMLTLNYILGLLVGIVPVSGILFIFLRNSHTDQRKNFIIHIAIGLVFLILILILLVLDHNDSMVVS